MGNVFGNVSDGLSTKLLDLKSAQLDLEQCSEDQRPRFKTKLRDAKTAFERKLQVTIDDTEKQELVLRQKGPDDDDWKSVVQKLQELSELKRQIDDDGEANEILDQLKQQQIEVVDRKQKMFGQLLIYSEIQKVIGRLLKTQKELNTDIDETYAKLEKGTGVAEKKNMVARKKQELLDLLKQNDCENSNCMENKIREIRDTRETLNEALNTNKREHTELQGKKARVKKAQGAIRQITDGKNKIIATQKLNHSIPTITHDIVITAEYKVTDSRNGPQQLSFQGLNELYERSIREWKADIGELDGAEIEISKRKIEAIITNIKESMKQTDNDINIAEGNVEAAKKFERELEEAESELEKAEKRLNTYNGVLKENIAKLKDVTDKLNEARNRLAPEIHKGNLDAGSRGKPGQNLAHMEAVLAGGAAADPEMYTQLFPPLIDLVWYEKTPYHALLLKLHSSLVPGPFPGQAIRDGNNFGYLGKDGNVEEGFVYDDTSHGVMHDIKKPERDGVKTQLPTKKTFKKTPPKLLRYVVRSKPGSTRRDDELIPYHSMDVVRHTLPIFPTFMGVIACLDERRKLRGTTGTGVQQALRPWFKYADFHASVKRHATSMTARQREALSATLMWDPATGLVPDPAAG